MARKAFYTDKLGRKWVWDKAAGKYKYVRKGQQVPQAAAAATTTAVAPPPAKPTTRKASKGKKRNAEIVQAYNDWLASQPTTTKQTAKEFYAGLVHKYMLSEARLRQIISSGTDGGGATATTTSRDKKAQLYVQASDMAKQLCNLTGVLPLGKEAEEYVQNNLHSIFQTTKQQVAYLRGVSASKPITSKSGAWLQDDDFLNLVQEEMQAIANQIEDGEGSWEDDALEWSMKNDDKMSDEDRSEKVQGRLDELQLAAVSWVQAIENIKKTKEVFEEVRKEFDEDLISQDLIAITDLPLLALGEIISPADRTELREVESTKGWRQNVEWSDLPKSVRELYETFGVTQSYYEQLRFKSGAIDNFLLAAFNEDLDPYIEAWLSPKPTTTYTSWRKTWETPVLAGGGSVDQNGNAISNPLTMERFRQGAAAIRMKYPKIAELFQNHMFVPPQFQLDQVRLHDRYGIRDLKDHNPPSVRQYLRYIGSEKQTTKLMPDGSLEESKATPFQVARTVPALLRDFKAAATSSFGKALAKQSTEAWEKYKAVVPNADATATWDVSRMPDKYLAAKLSAIDDDEVRKAVRYYPTGSEVLSYGVQMRDQTTRNAYYKSWSDRDQLFRVPHGDSSLQWKVEKSVSMPGRYGYYGGTTRQADWYKDDKGKQTNQIGAIRTIFDRQFNTVLRSDNAADLSLKYTIGMNYHLRKLTKYRKGAPKYFIWSDSLRLFTRDTNEDLVQGTGISDTSYVTSIEEGRKKLVAKNIVGKKKIVGGRPKIIIADAPKNEVQQQTDNFDKTWDKVNHGGFQGKVQHVFRVMYHDYYPKYKAIEEDYRKRYGDANVKYLYHGTHFEAGTKIIQGGFIIPKKVKSGRMLGDGVYLADKSSKSCQYLGGGFSRHGQHGVLLTCRAALGKMGDDTREMTRGQGLVNWECCVKNPQAVVPIYWMDVASV